MKGFPNYLVSLNHFGTNDPLAIGAFRDKNWSKGMIALLGEPVGRNEQGVVFYPQSAISVVKQKPEFAAELRLVATEHLETIGGPFEDVLEDVIAVGCEALYDLNKHIKTKVFTATLKKKAYDLKTNFIWYLYDQGYMSRVVFEDDTKFYRFHTHINGQDYVWHQPTYRCDGFVVGDVPHVTSEKIERENPPTFGHVSAMRTMERVVLSLFLKGW